MMADGNRTSKRQEMAGAARARPAEVGKMNECDVMDCWERTFSALKPADEATMNEGSVVQNGGKEAPSAPRRLSYK